MNSEAADCSMAASPLVMAFSPVVISAKGMVVLPMPMMISGMSMSPVEGQMLATREQQQIQPDGGDAGADKDDLKRAKLLHADADKEERRSPDQTKHPEGRPLAHDALLTNKRATQVKLCALNY